MSPRGGDALTEEAHVKSFRKSPWGREGTETSPSFGDWLLLFGDWVCGPPVATPVSGEKLNSLRARTGRAKGVACLPITRNENVPKLPSCTSGNPNPPEPSSAPLAGRRQSGPRWRAGEGRAEAPSGSLLCPAFPRFWRDLLTSSHREATGFLKAFSAEFRAQPRQAPARKPWRSEGEPRRLSPRRLLARDTPDRAASQPGGWTSKTRSAEGPVLLPRCPFPRGALTRRGLLQTRRNLPHGARPSPPHPCPKARLLGPSQASSGQEAEQTVGGPGAAGCGLQP